MIDQKKKEALYLELETNPIVSTALEKTGFANNSYYRLRREDAEFKTKTDKALELSRARVGDFAEGILINAIKNGDMGATKYYLSNNHSQYMKRRVEHEVEVEINTDTIRNTVEKMLNPKKVRAQKIRSVHGVDRTISYEKTKHFKK